MYIAQILEFPWPAVPVRLCWALGGEETRKPERFSPSDICSMSAEEGKKLARFSLAAKKHFSLNSHSR
jgi:hypothetical protein